MNPKRILMASLLIGRILPGAPHAAAEVGGALACLEKAGAGGGLPSCENTRRESTIEPVRLTLAGLDRDGTPRRPQPPVPSPRNPFLDRLDDVPSPDMEAKKERKTGLVEGLDNGATAGAARLSRAVFWPAREVYSKGQGGCKYMGGKHYDCDGPQVKGLLLAFVANPVAAALILPAAVLGGLSGGIAEAVKPGSTASWVPKARP